MSQFGGKRDWGLTCHFKPEETALPVFGAATSKAATRGIQAVAKKKKPEGLTFMYLDLLFLRQCNKHVR